jgi:hypothetical protein
VSTASKAMPKLSRGQTAVLILACVPMVAAGVAGGWGTYTNVVAEFRRSATALGVVAAGEGVTLVLSLVMVGLTMLGQSAPAPVRLGMWGAPLAAAVTGLVVADDATEAIVYAMTPMAMSASAEGLGLLARRIVVFRTGVDMEAQRRNAETVQRLNFHRARAANHPTKWVRNRSERASWRLAKRVGVGDEQLGASLVEVQRDRLRQGADAALTDMFGTAAAAPELPPAAVEPETTVERVPGAVPAAVPAVSAVPTPVYSPEDFEAMRAALEPVREPLVYPSEAARTEVHEHVPDPDWTVPGDYELTAGQEDEEELPDPDPLMARARKDFRDVEPSVRRIRETYSVGQTRAQRIRDGLKGAA